MVVLDGQQLRDFVSEHSVDLNHDKQAKCCLDELYIGGGLGSIQS
jgi:hypothetical protein